MKITKSQLKEIITEALEDQPAPPMGQPGSGTSAPAATSREKRVGTAVDTGGQMSPEEYTNTLKQVLLTKKVTPQVRKAALQDIFGNKGTAINTLITQLLKGVQQ
jgi:hypothetical protein